MSPIASLVCQLTIESHTPAQHWDDRLLGSSRTLVCKQHPTLRLERCRRSKGALNPLLLTPGKSPLSCARLINELNLRSSQLWYESELLFTHPGGPYEVSIPQSLSAATFSSAVWSSSISCSIDQSCSRAVSDPLPQASVLEHLDQQEDLVNSAARVEQAFRLDPNKYARRTPLRH